LFIRFTYAAAKVAAATGGAAGGKKKLLHIPAPRSLSAGAACAQYFLIPPCDSAAIKFGNARSYRERKNRRRHASR